VPVHVLFLPLPLHEQLVRPLQLAPLLGPTVWVPVEVDATLFQQPMAPLGQKSPLYVPLDGIVAVFEPPPGAVTQL
jgi:hypothetical protein